MSKDQIQAILDGFVSTAIQDRMRYKTVYETIEQYVAKYINNDAVTGLDSIVVGGSLSVAVLLDKPISKDDFIYILYSTSAFLHANALCNQIASVISLPMVVFLKTVLPYQRFDIVVDQRTLVRFNTMAFGKAVIEPLTANSPIANLSCNIMPPKFHLIELYRTLYNPAEVDNWQAALKDERRLYNYMRKIIDLTAEGKTIDIRRIRNLEPNESNDSNEQKDGGADLIQHKQRKQLSLAIMKKFVCNNKDVILIGEHAISMITKIFPETVTLHCIVSDAVPIQQIVKTLAAICEAELGQAYPVTISTRDPSVGCDARLRRIAVRLGSALDAKEIMYIYTSSKYDLIPFNRLRSGTPISKNNKNSKNHTMVLQIGNPFVLARFCLIELWILNQVVAAGSIDKAFAVSRTNSMLAKIIELRRNMSDGSSLKPLIEPGPMQIFQSDTDSYLGTYESDETSTKTAALAGKRFYDYFPQEWFHNKKQYRIITANDGEEAKK
jgi:hypothetical protein